MKTIQIRIAIVVIMVLFLAFLAIIVPWIDYAMGRLFYWPVKWLGDYWRWCEKKQAEMRAKR